MYKQDDFEQDDFSFVRPYLGNNEYILWKGRPEKGNLFIKRELLNSLAGVGALIFMFFWIRGAASSGNPVFAAFGIPMVLISLYHIFGRYIIIAITRRKTRYVITNRKIIRARGKKIDFLNGTNLPPYQTEVYANGCGSIYFRIQDMSTAPIQNNSRSYNGFSIINISDPMAVQAALERMEK